MSDRAGNLMRVAGNVYEGVSSGGYLRLLAVKLERELGLGTAQWTTISLRNGQVLENHVSCEVSQSLVDEYERHIQPIDPRMDAILKSSGKFVPCWELIDLDAFEKSIVCGEWADRPDIDRRWGAAGLLPIDTGHLGLLSFTRPRKFGPVQIDELDRVKRLKSHIGRAVRLHLLFRDANGKGRAFDRVWRSPAVAVFVLGPGRRLLASNHAAQTLLSTFGVFRARWGELTSPHTGLSQSLDHAIAAAQTAGVDDVPRTLTLAWPLTDRAALHCEVMSLRNGGAAEAGLRAQSETLLFARAVPRGESA